jgi:hypothetical protein
MEMLKCIIISMFSLGYDPFAKETPRKGIYTFKMDGILLKFADKLEGMAFSGL